MTVLRTSWLWVRWWLSPLHPIFAPAFGGFLLWLAWDGRGWPGVGLIAGFLLVLAPLLGHGQAWCLQGIERDLKKKNR